MSVVDATPCPDDAGQFISLGAFTEWADRQGSGMLHPDIDLDLDRRLGLARGQGARSVWILEGEVPTGRPGRAAQPLRARSCSFVCWILSFILVAHSYATPMLRAMSFRALGAATAKPLCKIAQASCR